MSHITETLANLEAKEDALGRIATQLEIDLNKAKVERAHLREAIKVVKALEDPQANKAPARKVEPTQAAKTERRWAKRQGTTSQYYGVSKLAPSKSNPGVDRYRAQIQVDGSYQFLGTFYGPVGEIEAAAKAQDAIGNPAEAQRLRQKAADLAEQLDANPDRPKSRRRKRQEPADLPSPAAHKWECNRCGRDYIAKPEKCPACRGKSFLRINADGSGQSDLRDSPDE